MHGLHQFAKKCCFILFFESFFIRPIWILETHERGKKQNSFMFREKDKDERGVIAVPDQVAFRSTIILVNENLKNGLVSHEKQS